MISINVLGLSNLHTFKFSVKEVCSIVGFSERTFHSRVKSGKLRTHQSTTEFCRDGRPRIYVTADDLAQYLRLTDEAVAREYMSLPAIVEEKPEVENDRKIFADVAAPPTRRVPDIREPDAFRPQEAGFSTNPAANQEAWNMGAVTDSLGNSVMGNERRPTTGVVSLLGPMADPVPTARPDTTSHMMPGTVGEAGRDRTENPVDSGAFAELLNPGHGERMKAMYANAGVKQRPSEQQQKQRNDIAAIRAAFRTGQWSR